MDLKRRPLILDDSLITGRGDRRQRSIWPSPKKHFHHLWLNACIDLRSTPSSNNILVLANHAVIIHVILILKLLNDEWKMSKRDHFTGAWFMVAMNSLVDLSSAPQEPIELLYVFYVSFWLLKDTCTSSSVTRFVFSLICDLTHPRSKLLGTISSASHKTNRKNFFKSSNRQVENLDKIIMKFTAANVLGCLLGKFWLAQLVGQNDSLFVTSCSCLLPLSHHCFVHITSWIDPSVVECCIGWREGKKIRCLVSTEDYLSFDQPSLQS